MVPRGLCCTASDVRVGVSGLAGDARHVVVFGPQPACARLHPYDAPLGRDLNGFARSDESLRRPDPHAERPGQLAHARGEALCVRLGGKH